MIKMERPEDEAKIRAIESMDSDEIRWWNHEIIDEMDRLESEGLL